MFLQYLHFMDEWTEAQRGYGSGITGVLHQGSLDPQVSPVNNYTNLSVQDNFL